jgi:formylglycine-generating enzyme required for sulfatase activity
VTENDEKVKEDIRRLEELKANGIMPADLAERLIAELHQKQAVYNTKLEGSGANAQGDYAKAVGAGGIFVDRDLIINRGEVQSSKPLPANEALCYYLDNLIAEHKHLHLQGIRAGSQPLSVALEKVYISLTAMDKHAPDSLRDPKLEVKEFYAESGFLTISSALKRYRRLVIIGDPGCGKTTLLAYLTLTYARALRQGDETVRERLSLDEADHLPIFLPLRDLGRHLKEEHPDPGKDGPALLLDYLHAYYLSQNIHLSDDFFLESLENGRAVILLDGMDEVAVLSLRQRTARLIERFAERYPKCRFVVTSRAVGYEGAARVGAQFGLACVRDFSPSEVRQFIHDWTRVIETTLAQSETPEILRLADAQSAKLIQAVDTNPRVAELAVNPLLLTVIALVHRYRAQLPERRSELYEEAVEVLLGHWDEAKGLDGTVEVVGVTQKLDSGDRRGLLEPVALWMHERNRREIELDDLRPLLMPPFQNLTGIRALASKAVDAFLRVINERSGLLIERGAGVYGFAHLTFQEYLAARALADRADALGFTVKVLPDPWWREVILLEAGYLGGQGKRRVSELIQTILDADPENEPDPHHNLLLAAECLFDVGPARVDGDLLGEARKRLKKQADVPFEKSDKVAVLAKITAINALARLESGKVAPQYWKLPYGEPEWITIPAGEFWMGGEGEHDGKPGHGLYLPEYRIARTAVTNAQYKLYVQDSNVKAPEHWRGGIAPAGQENHPVVNVSWDDAIAYCLWLSEKIEKPIGLPSEAEWEKAARGDKDRRAYSWGEDWRELHCNSSELGLGETTQVGLFLNGASPYGLLDMSGNVGEWTRTIWGPDFEYPYKIKDGRENFKNRSARVIRGGSFDDHSYYVRCAVRPGYLPSSRYPRFGFRVMIISPELLSNI